MDFRAKDRRLEGKSLKEQARLAELYLLDVFVEICEAYNLRYFLAYGTLIGAMRHNGFIPWDDDIDIGMPIDDYKKFLKIAPSVLPENLLLDHASTISGTAGCYAKIRDRSSFFCERTTDVSLPCGFFLDIFPFERLPVLSGGAYRKIARFCAISAWSYRAHLRKNHKGVCGVFLSAFFALSWKACHDVVRTLLWALKILGNSKWKNSPENGLMHMDGMEDEDIFPLSMHAFEGKDYCVPKNADLFLSQIFGDWRKLPPEKDRVWHADIICPTTPPRAWWAMPYKGGTKD